MKDYECYIKNCKCQSPKTARIKTICRVSLFVILAILIFVILNLYNNSNGAYSKELNFMLLFPKDNTASVNMTVAAHEIGHYVFFTKLSQSQRDEFINISRNSKTYITAYARTNEQEDFAEMFAYSTFCEFHPEYLEAQDTNKREFLIKYSEEMSK